MHYREEMIKYECSNDDMLDNGLYMGVAPPELVTRLCHTRHLVTSHAGH